MITYNDVATWLGLPPSQAGGDDPDPTLDDRNLISAVASTNVYVATLPYLVDDLKLTAPAVDVWPDDVKQGAVMYAAADYRRRNTPSGIDSFDGSAMYVQRNDPTIVRLLRLNRIRAR